MPHSTPPLSAAAPPPHYLVGIDVGSEQCSCCALTPAKTVVFKPFEFSNAAAGFALLQDQLTHLPARPEQIWIGLEATARYWENLYFFLEQRGYHLLLLHPGQTHHFAQQRGLRAKTDRLDATTIVRVLLSDELRPAYVPSAEIVAYRELVHVHTKLSEEAARSQLEIQSLVGVLFPEFTQVFADPCRATALVVLHAYPSATALAAAEVEQLTAVLRQAGPRRYGRPTARRLIALAASSVASGRAQAARARSLGILCDQLRHTQANLVQLEQEIAALLAQDPPASGLQTVPGFGPKTAAVLRAELGDVARFARSEQVVAYAGLDLVVKAANGAGSASCRSGAVASYGACSTWRPYGV